MPSESAFHSTPPKSCQGAFEAVLGVVLCDYQRFKIRKLRLLLGSLTKRAMHFVPLRRRRAHRVGGLSAGFGYACTCGYPM